MPEGERFPRFMLNLEWILPGIIQYSVDYYTNVIP